MADISIFQRTEKKYLISEDKYHRLMESIGDRIMPDAFGPSTIFSIYYDNYDCELIRESIERPTYKEKLRVRIYKPSDGEGKAFAEIKKKCNHVGYKRRVPLLTEDIKTCLEHDGLRNCVGNHEAADPQKAEEIRYMIDRYGLKPRIVIRCEREPYVTKEDRDVRLTFDKSIAGKYEDMDLEDENHYKPVTEEGMMVMEVKAPLALPMWLTKAMNDLEIYPGRFSKVGTYYTKNMNRMMGERLNVK